MRVSARSKELLSRVDRLEAENRSLLAYIAGEQELAASVETLRLLSVIAKALVLCEPVSSAPGVYFLLDSKGAVVYVGQSSNVALRLGGHRDKEFTDVRMIRIPDEIQRTRYEQLLIQLLRPMCNVVHNPDKSQQPVGEILATQ